METSEKEQPSFGDKAICKSCGNPIIYIGPYWKHNTGDWQPRHIAEPKDDNEPEKVVA